MATQTPMVTPKPSWKDPRIWVEAIPAIAGAAAIVLSVMDVIGLFEFAWFQNNLGKIVLILVSSLIIADFVERRFYTPRLKGQILAEIQSATSPHHQRMDAAGITNFYASRLDYAQYRGAPKLLDYLSTARKSIRIAGYWMAHGLEMEGIADSLSNMTRPPKNLDITIAIIDPTASYVPSLAAYLDMQPKELVARAQWSLEKLWNAREKLPQREKSRFHIKVHNSIPIASVIILDEEEPDGKVQVDLKAYKMPRENSFAFELRYRGHHLYDLCRDSWLKLLREADAFDPAVHLAGFSESNQDSI